MRDFIDIVEMVGKSYRFVELCGQMGLPEDLANTWTLRNGPFQNDFAAWQQYNDRDALTHILTQQYVSEISQVAYAFHKLTKNIKTLPMASVEAVHDVMAGSLVAYRGGTGTYDLNRVQGPVSFALSKKSAMRFGDYEERHRDALSHWNTMTLSKSGWLISVKASVSSILFYCGLSEDEVIFPASVIDHASLIYQK